MSFLGINGAEFVVLLIVVVVVLGPVRTARALVTLQKGVRKMTQWSADLRASMKAAREQDAAGLNGVTQTAAEMATTSQELGAAFSALNDLDPNQLDPRRMIREAVAEEMQAWMEEAQLSGAATPKAAPLPTAPTSAPTPAAGTSLPVTNTAPAARTSLSDASQAPSPASAAADEQPSQPATQNAPEK